MNIFNSLNFVLLILLISSQQQDNVHRNKGPIIWESYNMMASKQTIILTPNTINL
jgi:hypothetical protein